MPLWCSLKLTVFTDSCYYSFVTYHHVSRYAFTKTYDFANDQETKTLNVPIAVLLGICNLHIFYQTPSQHKVKPSASVIFFSFLSPQEA